MYTKIIEEVSQSAAGNCDKLVRVMMRKLLRVGKIICMYECIFIKDNVTLPAREC